MTLRVLLVGLGQMALGYDLAVDDPDVVLSHARAFSRHPDFDLAGGVDPDPERCSLFGKHYGGYTSGDLAAASSAIQPDVVVIASPTTDHGRNVSEVLQFSRPRLILCEKPISYDVAEAERMLADCAAKDCLLCVNYQRRVDKSVREIKRRIDMGEIHTPIKGVAWYSNGLIHNGSHFVNLLEFWLGRILKISIIEPGRLWKNDDSEPDVRVDFEAGTVTFLAARHENFAFHEIQLLGANGCLRYERNGRISWRVAEPASALQGQMVLGFDREEFGSETDTLMLDVVSEVSRSVNELPSDLCTGQDALETLRNIVRMKVGL